MSVGPVRDLPPAIEPEAPQRKARAAPPAPPPPDSEKTPTRETAAKEPAAPVPSVPQDEVRVQWDTPLADYIVIYQFVDQQSGSLILQMPDAQMLSLIHQIRETLQRAQQQTGEVAAAPVNPGQPVETK